MIDDSIIQTVVKARNGIELNREPNQEQSTMCTVKNNSDNDCLAEYGQCDIPTYKNDSNKLLLSAKTIHPPISDIRCPIPEDIEELPEYLSQSRSRRNIEMGSEKLITTNDLLLAATLVADAMDNQHMEFKREPKYVRSYNYYKSAALRYPLYMAITGILLLPLSEKPAVKILALPIEITMSIEGVCLLYFLLRACHFIHFRANRGLARDWKLICAITCIAITIVDMITYVLLEKFTGTQVVIRWSRILRPLLIICLTDGSQLKRAWENIRKTLNQIIHVIVLFYFLIVVFSIVAMKLFQFREDLVFPNGTPYFKTYTESFWNMYVLVTTANNPDVMIPAYNKNVAYCFFFTIHIILCLYLVLNILLAVTYNSYRENMKEQITHAAGVKMNALNQAFEVIKINVNGQEMVTYKTWKRLIQLAHPGKTKNQTDLLMMVLDTNKSGYLNREQFLNIADLLNVPISEVSQQKTFLQIHCPTIYNSRLSTQLRNVISSIYFSLCYDGIVLSNVIVLSLNIQIVEWPFLALYVLEIALKWYTFGTHRYFSNFINWTDVIITLVSVTEHFLALLKVEEDSEALRVLDVLRIFRILRCLVHFQRFRIIFQAVFNVTLTIITYCEILFIVFYSFAIVGMETFANRIEFLDYNGSNSSFEQLTCNNSALEGSVFSQNQYCKINFNNIFQALVVLASLLIVNNWHVICEAFTLVTNVYARLFFASFHLCIAVVVINIVTAFILDIFMYEYTFKKKGTLDTKVEATIRNLHLGLDDERVEKNRAALASAFQLEDSDQQNKQNH